MKRFLLLTVIILSVTAYASAEDKWVRKLEKTYSGSELDARSDNKSHERSETFGFAAEAFIPNCEIWLFGKLLEPVSAPDEPDVMGILIRKTKEKITINGATFLSLQATHKKFQKASYAAPELKESRRILGVAAQEFRAVAKKSDKQHNTYLVHGNTCRPHVPMLIKLKSRDVTVSVTILPNLRDGSDCFRVEYNGIKGIYRFGQRPKVDKVTADEMKLDNAFNSLIGACLPEYIILIGQGYRYGMHASHRGDFVDALMQISDLAVPTIKDIRGNMIYESLLINGIGFHSNVIRDFVNSKDR